MKGKQTTIIICIIAIILIAVGCIIVFGNKASEKGFQLNENEIANIKKSDKKLPKFSIQIHGIYSGTITNESLEKEGIQVYEFDAGINNGWDVVTNHYAGVKLKDVLEIAQIEDFTDIEFNSSNKIFTVYNKEEITDKTYLVFLRDGKPIKEGEPVTLLSADYHYRFSLENVEYIHVDNRVIEGTPV